MSLVLLLAAALTAVRVTLLAGTSIGLKKREGGGAAAGGGAALDGLEEEDGEDVDDEALGGGCAAVASAIQENLFLDEDVELPDDFDE